MLTQERLKELLSYDPETGLFIWIKSTNRSIKIGSVAGGKKPDSYICIRIDKKNYLSHRLAWLYVYGKLPEKFIDHINEIKNDNRICNLRLANNQQNKQNMSKPNKNNKIGLKGVYWHETGKKWVSIIVINGKNKHLGLFIAQQEAHEAYLKAKREFHPFWVEKKTA